MASHGRHTVSEGFVNKASRDKKETKNTSKPATGAGMLPRSMEECLNAQNVS
jgi:hypothetical protein